MLITFYVPFGWRGGPSFGTMSEHDAGRWKRAHSNTSPRFGLSPCCPDIFVYDEKQACKLYKIRLLY